MSAVTLKVLVHFILSYLSMLCFLFCFGTYFEYIRADTFLRNEHATDDIIFCGPDIGHIICDVDCAT